MTDFPPDRTDSAVVAVSSRRLGEERRSFDFEGPEPQGVEGLPDLSELEHEDELVESMRARGYRLTMIGGGAGTADTRVFYFRRTDS